MKKKMMENNFDSFEKKDLSKKAYVKLLKEVIESSNVILEVLDARDPEGCRSKELEDEIKNHRDKKKLIFILTKIDLVPRENAAKWKSYLEKFYPTIMFRANLEKKTTNLKTANVYQNSIESNKEFVNDILKSKLAFGTDKILELLKNYAEGKNITAGVVGYPNVGKSSLINSLKRMKVANVSNVPGYTKAIQEIRIDNDIKILDCPGVVFSHNDQNSLMYKNVLRVEDIHDPIPIAKNILNKVNKKELILLYETKDFDKSDQFLILLAQKRGKLIKTGIVDLDKAARIIIKDFNDGKIPCYTDPPNSENDIIMK